jgi:hypothetical protein
MTLSHRPSAFSDPVTLPQATDRLSTPTPDAPEAA